MRLSLILLTVLFSCNETLKFSKIHVAIRHDSIMSSGILTLKVTCDNVFNTNASNDWSINSVDVTDSVYVISNKSCHLSILNYNDNTNIFSPINSGSPLLINISSSGVISTPVSAVEYTTQGGQPILQWFSASQGLSNYSININFAADAVAAITALTPTNLQAQTVSVSNSQVAAPSVTSVIVTGTGLIIKLYTLTAIVTGSTGCKYINNSPPNPPYTPSNWISVNAAYNAAGAQSCPVLIPGSINLVIGNWSSQWQVGSKTLVMWANSVNGVNAYTTANVGP